MRDIYSGGMSTIERVAAKKETASVEEEAVVIESVPQEPHDAEAAEAVRQAELTEVADRLEQSGPTEFEAEASLKMKARENTEASFRQRLVEEDAQEKKEKDAINAQSAAVAGVGGAGVAGGLTASFIGIPLAGPILIVGAGLVATAGVYYIARKVLHGMKRKSQERNYNRDYAKRVKEIDSGIY